MRRMLAALLPWWPVLKVALLLGAVAALWLHGCHFGERRAESKHALELAKAASERIAWYEGQIAEQHAAAAVSRAQSEALAGQLDRLGATHADLRRALATVQLISNEVNRETNCPDPRLTPSLRLCRNAATLGDADAVAECAALGVPVPAATGPVLTQ